MLVYEFALAPDLGSRIQFQRVFSNWRQLRNKPTKLRMLQLSKKGLWGIGRLKPSANLALSLVLTSIAVGVKAQQILYKYGTIRLPGPEKLSAHDTSFLLPFR
ncbi:hypothetical protein K432DRAFT_384807 [Lepidopterella palustris CBS 459.81]|uniref:Uncharacterized protein n=1 Tax=Lepidopterella palustris CBS 459.81 TaxID=1314670 RepID=A0A8E2E4K8_9PEZI|nr:hypothetical protein K432DRAFT_384807 [Lepidopterella palustris CBS 459.81]